MQANNRLFGVLFWFVILGPFGALAVLPARALALTYGVAGSFGESLSGWRSYLASESDPVFDANERLLVHAGRGALGAGGGRGPMRQSGPGRRSRSRMLPSASGGW